MSAVSCMPRNEIKLHSNYHYCLQIILICNQNVHQQCAMFAENGEEECTAVIVAAQLQPAGRDQCNYLEVDPRTSIHNGVDQSIKHIILCHLLITGLKFSSFFMSDFIDHNGA